MIYLLNSPVLTAYGDYSFYGPLTLTQVKAKLTDDFISAIGHAATASVLSQLLERDIPINRVNITMLPGDEALVFRLLNRVAEGAVLSVAEIASIGYELSWLERLL